MTCQPPSKVLRQSGWQGSRDGYHPVVFSFAPVFWEDDFKGAGRLTDAGAERPLAVPAQVPGRGVHRRGRRLVQGGVRSRGVRQPEVTRFISSRQLDDPRINPFQRIAEIWFDDSEGWRKAFVEKAGQYTKPPWATWDSAALLRALQGLRGGLHPRPARLRPPAAVAGVHPPLADESDEDSDRAGRTALRGAREAHRRRHRAAQARPGAGLERRSRALPRGAAGHLARRADDGRGAVAGGELPDRALTTSPTWWR